MRDRPTYYAATANRQAAYPPLAGEIRTDVCILGAGFTGLSAAIELARRGYEVVVLEAESVGHGASGRSGGHVCTGFSCGMAAVEARLGREHAAACWAVAEDANALLRERVRDYQIACDLKWGYLHVASRRRHLAALREERDRWAAYGYTDAELLSRDGLRERLGSDAYHGALREVGAGHLHPLNYCLGLADAAVREGARIHESSRVTSVTTDAAPVVHTAAGVVRARHAVIAGNAYLGALIPRLRRMLMPVGSYILATEPLGENRARELIREDEAVSNTNFAVDYFRLSADRRMLFGGRASYSTLDPRDPFAFMRPRMLAVFPQLAGVRLDYCWGGHVGISRNRMPQLGRIGRAVYYVQGYSGQGVALSGIMGRLVAEAVAGTAERFDVMARIRHRPFPGGPFRIPLLVLGLLYYRLRDIVG